MDLLDLMIDVFGHGPNILHLVVLGMAFAALVGIAGLVSHRPALAWIAVGLTALCQLAAFSTVASFRGDFVHEVFHPQRAVHVSPLIFHLVHVIVGGALVAGGLLIWPVALAGLERALEGSQERRAIIAVAVTLTLTGALGLVLQLDWLHGLRDAVRSETTYGRVWARGLDDLERWRALVWVGAALLPLSALTRGRRVGWRGTAFALAVLLGAVALSRSTAALAHDTHHPVRAADHSGRWPCGDPYDGLPPTEAPPIAPLFTLCSPDRPRLDGRNMSPEQLHADLDTLRRNWAILHPREPFDGTLLVEVAPNVATEALAPYLAVAEDSGWHPRLVAVVADSIPTATLGPVEQLSLRSYPMPPLAGHATGRDLVLAAGRRAREL